MNDFLIRGWISELSVRFAWCGSTHLCAKGILAHDADPFAAPVFCEAMTGMALLSVLLDEGDVYSIRFRYPGAIGGIVGEVNESGALRALVENPHPANEINVPAELMGEEDGTLEITRSNNGKILNAGRSRAPMASPAADFSFFFSTSDQVETEMVCAARFAPDPAAPVRMAGGFLLQALPGCDLEMLDTVREKMHLPAFKEALLDEEAPFERRLKTMLRILAGDAAEKAKYVLGPEPCFRCRCSPEGMRRAMSVLGEEELRALFKENPSPEIRCNFCRAAYRFSARDFFPG